MNVEYTITLSEELANAAREHGLLTSEQITLLIEEALDRYDNKKANVENTWMKAFSKDGTVDYDELMSDVMSVSLDDLLRD